MKLKLDDKGAVVVQDDKPVYVADDGKEIAFDYPATLSTIARLNAEARGHREEKEALAEKLKPFEGIDDPVKALKALEIVKNLDDKKLIEAGEVERVRQEAKSAYDEQIKSIQKKYEPITGERDKYKADLEHEILGGAFSRSKYIADKLAVPADIVQAKFGRSFSIEAGNKVVGLDANGERIFSRARPGEVADFDEALEALVEEYPYRDTIVKGSGASGSGAGGSGRRVGGKRHISRVEFDALSPADRVTTAKAASAGELVIAD
jgi:hypothetical protein